MAAPLQGGVQFQDLRQDSAFLSAPPPDQIQYLMEDYLPKQDAAFAKAPEPEKLQYINEVVLPQLQQPEVSPASGSLPDVNRPNALPGKLVDLVGSSAASAALPFASAAKGLTMDYLDLEKPLMQYAQSADQRLGISPQQGVQSPSAQFGRAMGYGVGALKNFEMLGSAINKGAQFAGQKLLPYTATAAIKGGLSSPLSRPAMNALTFLQSSGLPAQMVRGALEFGGYEGLKSHPQNEFDLQARTTDALKALPMGAGMPVAGAALGKLVQAATPILEGSAKAFGEAINPSGMWHSSITPRLENLLTRLTELLEHPGMIGREAEKVGQMVQQVQKQVSEGRLPRNLPRMEKLATQLEHRAQFNAMRGRVRRPLQGRVESVQPQGQIQYQQGQQPAQGPQEIQQQPVQPKQPEKEAVTLQGSIKEMVDQGLKEYGGSLDDAKTLVGKVKTLGKADDDSAIQALVQQRKALGTGRDDATKQAKAEIDAEIKKLKDERKALRDEAGAIHGNLREVLNTEWDGASPVADQMPVDAAKQLKAEQVESLVTDPKEQTIFGKVKEAMKAGNSLRVEHQAEITGSTDAAAKVTGSGNVKVPVSTFTPTHFSVTKKTANGVTKEYVAAHGYNEAGHMSKYYITESPEGSKILKVNKVLPNEAFVGTVPNVELGPRKYKVADVLGRAEREEGVLTSDALAAAKTFKELFKSENLNKFSKQTQQELKNFLKRGKFDERSFERLYAQLEKHPEDLQLFCNLFGLV